MTPPGLIEREYRASVKHRDVFDKLCIPSCVHAREFAEWSASIYVCRYSLVLSRILWSYTRAYNVKCIYVTRVKTSKNIYAQIAQLGARGGEEEEGERGGSLTHSASSVPILPVTFPPLHLPLPPDRWTTVAAAATATASIITALRFVVVPRMRGLCACMRKILYIPQCIRCWHLRFAVMLYLFRTCYVLSYSNHCENHLSRLLNLKLHD